MILCNVDSNDLEPFGAVASPFGVSAEGDRRSEGRDEMEEMEACGELPIDWVSDRCMRVPACRD